MKPSGYAPVKKRQKLTVCLTSKVRDIFGVWHCEVVIGKKEYSFHIVSEFAVRKVEQLIRRHRPGAAVNLLKQFNVKEEV